jgi:hypothetical protein
MSLPAYVRFITRDTRLAKENEGRTVRRAFKTEAAARAHMAANGLSEDMLHFDVDFPNGSRISTKRLHSAADAEKFAAEHPMPVPDAKPAKAPESSPAEAPQAQAPAQEPSPISETPTAEAPAEQPKPVLTVVGGNGFTEKPKRAPRQEARAAGINAKTEAAATRRNAARGSKA